MNILEKTKAIIKTLQKQYPDARIALKYGNPFELLVATILSAQCTDVRVNIVTEKLFKKYKTVKDYANADTNEFEQDIRSTGFYKNKAKNIIGMAKTVLEKFAGKLPSTLEELTSLPGVGRKTANVLLGSAFGIAVGIVVDTHVIRLSQLIGLSKNKDPEKIEQDLMKIVPQKYWIIFSHLIIFHGRNICKARKPNCSICPINQVCNFPKKI